MYWNTLNPFSGAFFFVLVLFSPSVFGLTTIYDAFEVASGNEPASCDKYKAQLNQFWTESQTLAQNAITVLDAIEGSPADDQAAQLLCTFFGIDNNTPPSRTKIREWFESVKGFLNGQALPNSAAGKPLLFCGDGWLVKQKWTDQVNDQNGAPIYQNGKPFSIFDQASSGVANQWMYFYDETLVPWYSTKLKGYLFGLGSRYCTRASNGAVNLAGTQDLTPRSTMSLCPISFAANADTGVPTLGGTVPKMGDFIQKSTSLSVTLFHELFHLVLGNVATPDVAYKARDCIDLAGNPDSSERAETLSNPESYAYFSLAAFYYKNKGVYFRGGDAIILKNS